MRRLLKSRKSSCRVPRSQSEPALSSKVLDSKEQERLRFTASLHPAAEPEPINEEDDEDDYDIASSYSCPTSPSSSLHAPPPPPPHRRRRNNNHKHHKRRPLHAMSKGLSKLGNAIAPPMTNTHESNYCPPVKHLLHGCGTSQEHREYVATFLECVRDLHGQEGLSAVGFEYRLFYCDQHKPSKQDANNNNNNNQHNSKSSTSTTTLHRFDSWHENTQPCPPPGCADCVTRLVHVETDTCITKDNRKSFVADGHMYEEMARLCQEYAQHVMQQEGDLEWVTVCSKEKDDDASQQQEPVRALVHMDHHLVRAVYRVPDHDRPILLVVTGKGKVRAGIFSREHLMTTGLEPGSAIPMVREAARRNMSIILLDPNARGDQQGMDTFETSVQLLLGHLEKGEQESQEEDETRSGHHEEPRSLYIVAHSASGAQLVRYLLDRVHIYAPYLRAIAFTDSTHNIQWARDNAQLRQLLGSSQCVYFKSSRNGDDDDRQPGEQVQTDKFWHSRFGQIRTMWAGTKEHALTNWFAHTYIWDHFDSHLLMDPLRLFGGRRRIEEEAASSTNMPNRNFGREERENVLSPGYDDDEQEVESCDELALSTLCGQG